MGNETDERRATTGGGSIVISFAPQFLQGKVCQNPNLSPKKWGSTKKLSV